MKSILYRPGPPPESAKRTRTEDYLTLERSIDDGSSWSTVMTGDSTRIPLRCLLVSIRESIEIQVRHDVAACTRLGIEHRLGLDLAGNAYVAI